MAYRIPGVNIEQANLGVSRITETPNAFTEVGQNLAVQSDIMMRKEKRDADAYVSQKSTELVLESQELLNQTVLETENPEEITNVFLSKYNDLYATKVAGSPNELARRELEAKSNTLRTTMGKAAIGVQAEEIQATRLFNLQESVNKAVINTRNNGNYALGELALEEALSNAESYTTPSQLMELKKQGANQLKGAYLDKLFERENIGEVRRLINDPEFNQDLNLAQIDSYRTAIKKYNESKAKAGQVSANIAALFSGDTNQVAVFDPKNKQDKGFVDDVYKSSTMSELLGAEPASEELVMADAIRNLDPNAINGVVAITKATGIVPDDLKSFIRGGLVSNNQDVRAYSSQIVSEMATQTPRAFIQSGFSEKELLEARMYTKMRDAGFTGAEIDERINMEVFTQDPVVLETRRKELNDSKSPVKPENSIEEVFDDRFMIDIFSSSPELPASPNASLAIENEYKSLFNDNYILTGDSEIASRRAEEIIKGTYGVSRVTGKEIIMRNPPETAAGSPYFFDAVEGDNNNYEWQSKQLLNGVRTKLNRKDIDIDSVVVLSDGVTEKLVKSGQKPSYNILVKDEDGAPISIGRFVFDEQQAIEELKEQKRKERELYNKQGSKLKEMRVK